MGRWSLKISAGDLDVAKGGEHGVGEVVDGNAVDGDEHAPGSFTKGAGEVKYVFDGGW